MKNILKFALVIGLFFIGNWSLKADRCENDPNTGECVAIWVESTYVNGGCAGPYSDCVIRVPIQ